MPNLKPSLPRKGYFKGASNSKTCQGQVELPTVTSKEGIIGRFIIFTGAFFTFLGTDDSYKDMYSFATGNSLKLKLIHIVSHCTNRFLSNLVGPRVEWGSLKCNNIQNECFPIKDTIKSGLFNDVWCCEESFPCGFEVFNVSKIYT